MRSGDAVDVLLGMNEHGDLFFCRGMAGGDQRLKQVLRDSSSVDWCPMFCTRKRRVVNDGNAYFGI